MQGLAKTLLVCLILWATTASAEDEGVEKDAAVAGVAAGGATAVGIGAAASTASAATVTSTLALVGGGSMAVGVGVVAAVPIIVGLGAYGIWSLVTDDEE